MDYSPSDINTKHEITFLIHGLTSHTRTCKVLRCTPNAIMIRTDVLDEYEPTKKADVWLPRYVITVISKKKNTFLISLPGHIYESKFLTQENIYKSK